MGFLEYENEPGDLSLQHNKVLTVFTIGNGIGFIYGTMFHKKENADCYFQDLKWHVWESNIPVRHFLKRKISRPIYPNFLRVYVYFCCISDSILDL